MIADLKTEPKVVGAKQTLRALEQGWAIRVYVAKDAEDKVLRPIKEQCEEKRIPIIEVETRAHLGLACGIQVKASVAAIIE